MAIVQGVSEFYSGAMGIFEELRWNRECEIQVLALSLVRLHRLSANSRCPAFTEDGASLRCVGVSRRPGHPRRRGLRRR